MTALRRRLAKALLHLASWVMPAVDELDATYRWPLADGEGEALEPPLDDEVPYDPLLSDAPGWWDR